MEQSVPQQIIDTFLLGKEYKDISFMNVFTQIQALFCCFRLTIALGFTNKHSVHICAHEEYMTRN